MLSAPADRAAAVSAYDESIALLANANRPFDAARSRLSYGQFLRRQRRRADAREHLRAALDGFERLGAEPWAERARAELRATGETARRRDAGPVTDLTPQELQIARLVSAGNSNKDVATQLFLSPRTVEYHLAKVFNKLGISSRAQLISQAPVLIPVG
jgi:DNA-binding NarL/FixJ family response regulator